MQTPLAPLALRPQPAEGVLQVVRSHDRLQVDAGLLQSKTGLSITGPCPAVIESQVMLTSGRLQLLTFGLQCLQSVTSPSLRVALHPRQACLIFANFMMPPEATDGMLTWIERVWSPATYEYHDNEPPLATDCNASLSAATLCSAICLPESSAFGFGINGSKIRRTGWLRWCSR